MFFTGDFYPTPPAVIDQMLEGLNIQGKVILEPSAGSGNLVTALQQAGAREVIACENDSQLKKIVASYCKLIADDFLTVTSEQISHIDAVVMNPPFSNGAEHINHAFNIAPAGCQIVALCNIQTLKNPYTKSRKELKATVERYGQWIDLGDCFATAERKTGVEIALIRMQKPVNSYEQEFSGFFMGEDEEEKQENALMSYNAVRDLVNRYVECIKIYDQQLETAVRLNDIQKDYFDTASPYNDSKGEISITINQGGRELARNEFKKRMQRSGWHWIFKTMDLNKYSTKGLREDINKFVEKQTEIPFTMRNIYHMLDMVIQTTGQRMDKAIIEVFEKVTQHHADNRYNLEGWKTNSHYLLTEKFIMPNVVQSDWGSGLRTNYHGWAEPIEDMIKALCYITGFNYDETTRLDDFLRDNKCTWGQWYSWGFFEIKCFKKGTTHFKFQDKDLWAKFNQHVARIKGYPLPEKKAQTAYQERQNGRKPAQPAYKPTPQKPVILATFKV